MKINSELVTGARKRNSWTQEELATASGLNLRTIQRIETDGVASLQSVKALAATLEIEVHDLELKGTPTKERPMKSCPECNSGRVYRYEGGVDMQSVAGNLLPGLSGGFFGALKATPVVCADCGYLRWYLTGESTAKLASAKKWQPV